ncbi:MAG TPA: AraC family transcriptional regulator, partial [Clostridia bacterium]|nr:AraC family transcriptional regulator [Clostridia bacterium]
PSDVFSQMVVTRICSICRVNLTKQDSGGMKNRPVNAIYIKVRGKTTYSSVDGTHVSDANHVVFLPKGSTYYVRFDEPGECFRIEFDADPADIHILSIDVKNPLSLIHHITKLENLWLFKKPGYLPHTMQTLYGVLAHLDELTSTAYIPSEKFRLIEEAVRHLEDNYSDPGLRISTLAKIAGISEVYFRRVFNEIYHVQPARYIRNIRIERAKELLLSDFGSIDEIAHAVGFSNIYHFYKTFKQIMGQTPTDFAKH